eukprot:CAMPEP_0198369152 /NCGR_PEP_ID=MMETSP1450-20131203/156065_1 /TAXON_ID=753684 ORGANISM="Madagascaria erythrocladiodes, Strain CCMP3234" /NCGR_SAMPLE_ID=MMETSP1450 /ASSEMBLY_ACC=CAM_ASM_001115 /LENGTH=87 /DNA_ID=CAMNT_0044076671 /DNA_START=555 /DNA_END=815 /DNA_ORIENTATION=+
MGKSMVSGIDNSDNGENYHLAVPLDAVEGQFAHHVAASHSMWDQRWKVRVGIARLLPWMRLCYFSDSQKISLVASFAGHDEVYRRIR